MTLETGTKFCPDCDAERPLDEFYKIRAPRYRGGFRYSAFCKMHTIARNTAARANAPEGSGIKQAVKRANKKWATAHPEANRVAQARWRERHPETAKKRHRDWQINNPGANREKALRYFRKKRNQRLLGEGD